MAFILGARPLGGFARLPPQFHRPGGRRRHGPRQMPAKIRKSHRLVGPHTHHQIGTSQFMLHEPKGLPNPPLDPVPPDRHAHLATDRKPQPRVTKPIGQRVHHHRPTHSVHPGRKNSIKLARVRQSVAGPKSRTLTRRWRFLNCSRVRWGIVGHGVGGRGWEVGGRGWEAGGGRGEWRWAAVGGGGHHTARTTLQGLENHTSREGGRIPTSTHITPAAISHSRDESSVAQRSSRDGSPRSGFSGSTSGGGSSEA